MAGAGGQGGGGAGGDSYCYYVGGGAPAAVVNGLACAPHTAGQGGMPNGVDGYVGDTNTMD
jgi:hypothetical protein